MTKKSLQGVRVSLKNAGRTTSPTSSSDLLTVKRKSDDAAFRNVMIECMCFLQGGLETVVYPTGSGPFPLSLHRASPQTKAGISPQE